MWIFPVVIGTGKRSFGEEPIPVDTGFFEFDEPTEAELERRQRLAEV